MIFTNAHKKEAHKMNVGGLQTEFILWITKDATYTCLPGLICLHNLLTQSVFFIESLYVGVMVLKQYF